MSEMKKSIPKSHRPVADPPSLVDALLQERSVKSVPGLPEKLVELRRRAPNVNATSQARNLFLLELSRLLFFNQLQRVMHRFAIPFPVYNHLEDLAENEKAPWAPPLRKRPKVAGRSWRLFGRDIGIPIGIPASVLTMNAEWLGYHAQNGFNVLTYKTVRTKARPFLQPPNWIFISTPSKPVQPTEVSRVQASGGLDVWPSDATKFSTANSFGVPSKDPAEWIPDVQRTLRRLAADQLLILSVMGIFEEMQGSELVENFAEAAQLASGTGVSAVELNLSCPNGVVDGYPLPPICEDREMVQQIVEAARSRLDPTVSLVVKFSYLGADQLYTTLAPIVDIIDGVSGINALQVSVKDSMTPSKDAFPERSEAGISGYVIQDLATDFIRSASDIRLELGGAFDIIGMGGVMSSYDVLRLYKVGASAVQTATGAFFNHYLARDLVEDLGQTFPKHEPTDISNLDYARTEVLKVLKKRSPLTVVDVSAQSGVEPSVVRRAIQDLLGAKLVRTLGDGSDLTRLYALSP